MEQISLGNITVEVELKDIKNIHLSVYPPEGRVRIAAPLRMNLDTIRIYAISRLGWIRKQQHKFLNQEREAPREYLNRETHYFLGTRYQLQIAEVDAPPKVELQHKTILLHLRPGSDSQKKKLLLEKWYRQQLKAVALPMISLWEKRMKVHVNDFGIKKMKTKWGTCNEQDKRIWLNLELAKKPIDCIEYIIVHEMVHLLERNHNERFIAYMNKFLPQWREVKKELNRLPIV